MTMKQISLLHIKEAYQNNTLVYDNIFCLFKDNSIMWIGTYSGVSI